MERIVQTGRRFRKKNFCSFLQCSFKPNQYSAFNCFFTHQPTRGVFRLRLYCKKERKKIGLLCISTNTTWNFFQPFSTLFVYFKPFSVTSRLKSLKNVWKWTKKHIYSIFVYSSKLVKVYFLQSQLILIVQEIRKTLVNNLMNISSIQGALVLLL